MATPRPILRFGPRVLGSSVKSVGLSRSAYTLDYEGGRRFQIVAWPEGSWLGRYYLRQFHRYPTITAHGVTAYGLRDLVFRTSGSVARVSANPPFSKAERRTLLDALRPLSP